MAGKEEEILRERMKQYISRARIFVDRYIKDGYEGSDDLDKYVSKYEERARPIVAGAICSRLVEKTDLKNYKRLLKGLRSLNGYMSGSSMKEVEERIMDVCGEYEYKKEESYKDLKKELEAPLKNSWKQQGISGSAVEVNVEGSSQWNDMVDKLEAKYNRLLDGIKRGEL
ncbi:MAG: hypothetical protein HY739_11410 [Desulfobacterales bacterium]|nr:hypothetical protein [Desulfobacterales bacterium]